LATCAKVVMGESGNWHRFYIFLRRSDAHDARIR
jgi:hypothetical protein